MPSTKTTFFISKRSMDHDIRKLFPNASPGFVKANSKACDTRKAAVMELNPKPRTLGESKAKKGDTERVHICFVSVRKRLLDPDNLCEKYHLDLVRRCGAIEGDEPEKITLETGQRKVKKGEQEHTEIRIYKL